MRAASRRRQLGRRDRSVRRLILIVGSADRRNEKPDRQKTGKAGFPAKRPMAASARWCQRTIPPEEFRTPGQSAGRPSVRDDALTPGPSTSQVAWVRPNKSPVSAALELNFAPGARSPIALSSRAFRDVWPHRGRCGRDQGSVFRFGCDAVVLLIQANVRPGFFPTSGPSSNQSKPDVSYG